MYIKKAYGYVITEKNAIPITKGLPDSYNPPTTKSENWKHWIKHMSFVTCGECLDLIGCKYLCEIHERIRTAFVFPEWYG